MSDENDVLFQRAKAYLMQADADGLSAYDLLYRAVYAMIDENPNDVANHPERLNDVLSMLKRYQAPSGREVTATASSARAPAKGHHSQQTVASQNVALLERPKPEAKTTITRPSPNTTITTTTVVHPTGPAFQSVARDNTLWRFCGLGLPDSEAFLVDQSIAKLAREKKLEDVRFVGKIFGLRGNYLLLSTKRFVAPESGEQVLKEIYATPKAPRKQATVDVQPEPAYKGCNRLSFWVAPHAGAPWVLLPDTNPQLINAARVTNKMFVGELDAPVVTHPQFPGTERDYLRAQLSRIVASTYVAPVGALERPEVEDEDEDDLFDDNGKPRPPKPAVYHPLTIPSREYQPDVEAGVAGLLDMEQWVHAEEHIFKTGRQSRVPPKPDEDDDQEDQDQPEEEAEEAEEPEEDEEERELFMPVKRDYLYAVIDVPREPNPEEDEEEGEAEEPQEVDPEALAEKEKEDEAAMKKPQEDDDVADDDPLKKKVTAWTAAVVNAIYKKHAVVALRSVRWPGAVAFAAQAGKLWGSVYMGTGVKATDAGFAPQAPPKIQKECKGLLEVQDPTAANEKLVYRGEEPKENDSEDEQPDEDEDEEADL